MVSFRLASAAAAILATFATADTLTINTPTSLIVCQPSLISWSGGTAPYYVTILPGGQTTATALETLLSDSDDTSVSWTVDIASGTSLTFALKDSTGALAYTAEVTTQAGTSTSCIGTDSASSGSASASSTSVTTAGTSTSAAASSSHSSSSATSAASAATSSRVSTVTTSSSTSSVTSASKSNTSAVSSSTGASASASASTTASGASQKLAGAGIAGLAAAFAVVLA